MAMRWSAAEAERSRVRGAERPRERRSREHLLSQIYTRFTRYTVRTHPRSDQPPHGPITHDRLQDKTHHMHSCHAPHSTSRIQSRIAEYAGRSSSSSATTAAIARELAPPRLPDDAGCVIVATAAEEAVVVLLAVVCPAVADG